MTTTYFYTAYTPNCAGTTYEAAVSPEKAIALAKEYANETYPDQKVCVVVMEKSSGRVVYKEAFATKSNDLSMVTNMADFLEEHGVTVVGFTSRSIKVMDESEKIISIDADERSVMEYLLYSEDGLSLI